MQRSVSRARALRGTVVPPGDKSVSHRAAIFNAISGGQAVIENFQSGADCLATLRCLRLLGVDWAWRDEATLEITGRGLHALREPEAVLDCRNSGTTMRLLSGLLAAQPFFSVITGDASLRRRPMDRVVEPLRWMGAHIDGRENDGRAPLAFRGGALRGLSYRLPVASAQVKSALLLAGLYAEGETEIQEPAPTRDHSERLLLAMGAAIESREGSLRVAGHSGELSPNSLRVPGDISAAAAWLVLAAAHPDAEVRISGVGVNPTRTGVLDVLRMMGADIRLEEERSWGPEPVADLVVRSSRLRGTVIGGDLIPRTIDELPLLALAGCLAEGEAVIRDAAELRSKESDRVATTAAELRRLGATVEERADGLVVRGSQRLTGSRVSSRGDHRLAMMLGVAGALVQGETIIRNAGAIAVSYPWFWRDLGRLVAQ
jgi:3-phosphoshikimate 1-carboxyvinyltransferase